MYDEHITISAHGLLPTTDTNRVWPFLSYGSSSSPPLLIFTESRLPSLLPHWHPLSHLYSLLHVHLKDSHLQTHYLLCLTPSIIYLTLALKHTHARTHTHVRTHADKHTHTHTCCEEGEDVSNMKVDNMTSIIYGCHMWWLSSSYLQKSGEKSVTGIWLSYLWGGSWLWHCPLVIVNTCTAMCRLWCRPLSHNFFSQESVACVPLYTLFDFLLRTPF